MQSLEESLNKFYQYNNHNSYLYSFEGIEGSGKSTQIQRLKEYLLKKNYSVLILREPGGTKFGESLRESILSSETPLAPIAEAYLFASSSPQLLNEKILPYLKNPNHIVILDRYLDSSIAYQGYARELGLKTILDIHTIPPLNIFPNKTFYLAISIQESMQRQAKRGNEKDYFEKENSAFYQQLYNGFEDCLKYFPKRICKIDATKSIENVSMQIQKELENTL